MDYPILRVEPRMRKKENKRPDRVYKLKVIVKDQREYLEGVRRFLSNGLGGKGKIVGGPTDKSDLEKKTYIGESLVA